LQLLCRELEIRHADQLRELRQCASEERERVRAEAAATATEEAKVKWAVAEDAARREWEILIAVRHFLP